MKAKQQYTPQDLKNTITSPTLNIVIVGHVDHGKSTLIGKLLFDCGALPQERIDAVKDLCKRQNREFEYAYFLDALEEEQAQNVTIDTTRIKLHTKQREICIIDAPGHREFLKNMVTGAASANAAILIVDVSEGVQAQTKAHANILLHLGVKYVLVAINKMDKVNYDKHRFNSVKENIISYLQKLKVNPLAIVPVSAREGELVTTLSAKMSWYKGLSILQWLDKIPLDNLTNEKHFRIPIQNVYTLKGEQRVYLGQVTAGKIKVGDTVRVEPHKTITKVRKLYRSNTEVSELIAGDPAGIVLHDQIFAERGNMIVSGHEKQSAQKTITASVFWFHKDPLKVSQQVTIMLATARANAKVSQIFNKLNSSELSLIKADSQELKQGESAALILNFQAPLFVDRHQDYIETGRFVIATPTGIAGGGIIKEIEQIDSVKQLAPGKPFPKESKARSLLKALSWRLIATISTAMIAWFITSSFDFAIAIGLIDIIWKLFLYYFHERIWEKINFGKKRFGNINDVAFAKNENLTIKKPK